jgi:ribonuclease J
MEIIIHRGTHQIGGCVTEIRSNAGTRIIIDVGAELPGKSGAKKTPLNINELTDGCNGVFITHYHGDHVGEYWKVHENADIYMGKDAKNIFRILQERLSRSPKHTGVEEEYVKRIDTFKNFEQADTIPGIKITPILVDHSAFDSYMLLVECDGKRILHTGDFRFHGEIGKESIAIIESKVGKEKIDVLICEGTMLSRNSKDVDSEEILSQKAEQIIKDNKYVFILCSSTNIDRIEAFYRANMRANDERRANNLSGSKTFTADTYQLDVLKEVEKSTKYKKRKNKVDFQIVNYDTNNHDIDTNEIGFCMLVRPGVNKPWNKFKKIMNEFPKAVLIYSVWEGYLKEETRDEDIYSFVPKDEEGDPEYIYLHTSGHATHEAIDMLLGIAKPKMIIPIHGEDPRNFYAFKRPDYIIKILEDGDVFNVNTGEIKNPFFTETIDSDKKQIVIDLESNVLSMMSSKAGFRRVETSYAKHICEKPCSTFILKYLLPEINGIKGAQELSDRFIYHSINLSKTFPNRVELNPSIDTGVENESFHRSFNWEWHKRFLKRNELKPLKLLKSEVKNGNGKIFPALRKGNINFYYFGGVLYTLTCQTIGRRNKNYKKYNDGVTNDMCEYEQRRRQNENRFSSEGGNDQERALLSALYPFTYSDKKANVVVLDIEVRLNGKIHTGKKCDMVLLNKSKREIMFVEAKIFTDSRVRVTKDEVPPVVEQVNAYSQSIAEQRKWIPQQYIEFIQIMNQVFEIDLLKGFDSSNELTLIEPAKLLVFNTPASERRDENLNWKHSYEMIENGLGKENVMWHEGTDAPCLEQVWEKLTEDKS